MKKRLKFAISLAILTFSFVLMSWCVYASSNHTVTTSNYIEFDIEDNIEFKLNANAYHGNYKNEVLSLVTDYAGRTDEPTPFYNGDTLEVGISDRQNAVLSAGWAPFTVNSGVITPKENTLVWQFVVENIGNNSLTVSLQYPEQIWNEDIETSTNFELITTYELGDGSVYDHPSTTTVETTANKKFVRTTIRFTVLNIKQNFNINPRFNFTFIIGSNENVYSTPEMFGFTQNNDGQSYSLTSATLDENVNVVVIPEEYNGKPVTSINSTGSQGIFYNNLNIKEVVLPDTITKILNTSSAPGYSGAFNGCRNLKFINLEKITEIGAFSFYNCRCLNNINLNNLITLSTLDVGSNKYGYAFGMCYALTELNLPKITNIPMATFGRCSALYEVNLPTFVNSITFSQIAFLECYSLTSIVLPETNSGTIESSAFTDTGLTGNMHIPLNYTLLGDSNSAFYGLQLESFTTPEENTVYKTIDGVLYKLTDGVITYIDDYPAAKQGDYQIPKTVTNYRRYIFDPVVGLSGISVESGNQTYTVVNGVLYDKAVKTLLLIPNTMTEEPTIPNTVKFIGVNYTQTQETNKVLSKGGTGIGGLKITSLTLPSSVVAIGPCAFQNLVNLKRVNSNIDGVFDFSGINIFEIGYKALENSNHMTTLKLPSTITRLGNGIIRHVTSLTTIYCYATTAPTFLTGQYVTDLTKVFSNCTIQNLYIPTSSTSSYSNTAGWSSLADKITEI